jgi:hypothetical protein
LTDQETGAAQRIVTGNWFCRALLCLYDSLTLNSPPVPADLILVIAGRMDRKAYGLELYDKGLAPRLLLSTGRFEVSRMRALSIRGVEELIALRDRLPARQRHFAVQLDSSGTKFQTLPLPRWSTYGEALGLRPLLLQKAVGRVLVVSTDVHLRRVALSFSKIFRGGAIEFSYCPVPQRLTGIKREGWWTRPADRSFVIRELWKLAGYRLILLFPGWLSRRLMRLKWEPSAPAV